MHTAEGTFIDRYLGRAHLGQAAGTIINQSSQEDRKILSSKPPTPSIGEKQNHSATVLQISCFMLLYVHINTTEIFFMLKTLQNRKTNTPKAPPSVRGGTSPSKLVVCSYAMNEYFFSL